MTMTMTFAHVDQESCEWKEGCFEIEDEFGSKMLSAAEPSETKNTLSEALAVHGAFKCRWSDAQIIVVRNLPQELDFLRAMKVLFSYPIPVESLEFIYIPCIHESDKIRGFAMLKFVDQTSAMNCREIFHGKVLKRNSAKVRLVVDPATFMSLDFNGKMFCDNDHMKPLHMKDPKVQQLVQKLRMTKSERTERKKLLCSGF
eukprot:TRINITY_DN51793_c0_g1_i1.p1 TRINITY_DN51793_c0_g1~~TRINITY_DN51793_c0_g1_i1.p1  ORF type:complete len:224 (+),score=40.85 TRINITY_DN51793_c0_g1_i1:72-674(+)